MAKDYYKILGLEKSASVDDIKKAYRKLAHQYHPDKKGGDEQKFKEINEAYQTLSNKEKRAQYDQFGQAFQGGAGGFGGGQGFGGFEGFDFGGGGKGFEFNFGGGDFSDMFGDVFSSFTGGRSSGAQRGADIGVDMEISFEEMAKGTEKNLELFKKVKCDKCGGNGAEPGKGMETCDACKGTGKIKTQRRTILGSFVSTSPCEKCSGKGEIPKEKCHKCKGDGTVRDKAVIEVKVPGGIESGQTLNLSGQGEPGEMGGPAGDLYITIHVKDNKNFTRKENDIWYTAKIPFSLAALGGKIDVPTLNGEIKIKIPAGTSSGKIFRVKGEGVKKLRGYGKGDFMIEIQIDVPQKLSWKQKGLIKDLRDEGM